jgi:hypothetical protein
VAEYVAFARLDGGQVRPLMGRGTRIDDVEHRLTAGVVASSPSSPSRPPAQLARDAWAVAREEWAITTFFLFDPNSWRR